jgi:hypothetical protein
MSKFEKAVLGLLGAIVVLLGLHLLWPVGRYQGFAPGLIVDTRSGAVTDVYGSPMGEATSAAAASAAAPRR